MVRARRRRLRPPPVRSLAKGENGVVPNSEELSELALQKPGGAAGPRACCGMIQRPSPVAVV